MLRQEKLTLEALERDFKRLSKLANKAKTGCDEYLEIGTEAIAIHTEFADIVKSNKHGQEVIDKLDLLSKRRANVDAVMKKDFIKLMDKQHEAEMNRDALGSEIQMLQYRQELRSR